MPDIDATIRTLYTVGTSYGQIHALHDAATGTILEDSGVCGQYIQYSYVALYRLALLFDTSDMPEGINNASIIFGSYSAAGGYGLTVILQHGQPTYPHDPVVGGDYLYTQYSGNYGSMAYRGHELIITDMDCINPGGITKLLLKSNWDIDEDWIHWDLLNGCTDIKLRYSTDSYIYVDSITPALTFGNTVAIKGNNPYTGLLLGDIVTVIDEELGINIKARVVKIIRNLNGPLDVKVQVQAINNDMIPLLNKDRRWSLQRY